MDKVGNKFALKILNTASNTRRAFEAEIEALTIVKHTNIVNLIGYGERGSGSGAV